ncbi:MAG: Ig-like domain-containing protein, partial [Gemmatimonadetes bacterium]|nr:Ig-like domain-containing protein [Gemmatimonadota bacterium]
MRRPCIIALLCTAAVVHADPGPGDIFRELPMHLPIWQRVTDPEATASGAARHPNTINRKRIDDLQDAIRAEIYLEMWGGHAGTSDKRLRLNGGPWISIPDPEAIPGDAGREAYQDPECYQQFIYPSVPVPVEQLVEGVNTLEFTSGGQTCFNFGWGQWGLHGITFRIYYDAVRPHPTGRILTPATGSTIAAEVLLEAEASSPNGDIAQVDFIGLYEDFDYEGNGQYRQWHYRYRSGEIRNHLGTATESPFAVNWHTTWVPDQEEPMRIMARIKDDSGLVYMTPAVEGIDLERPGTSVKLYKPYNVPARWQTRLGARLGSRVFVADDLTRAEDARLVLTTWNGASVDVVGLNDAILGSRLGSGHLFSYDEI